jgi:hypothetical protein
MIQKPPYLPQTNEYCSFKVCGATTVCSSSSRTMELNQNLDKMKRYVVMTQNLMADQDRKCAKLQEELKACQRLIQGLQLNDREGLEIVDIEQVVQSVSQFSLDKLHSGGEIVQCTRLQVELAENVVLVETNGVHGLFRVLLSQSDPCPSPNVGENAEAVEIAIDLGKTMCDIWEGLYTSEKIKAHCDNRKELKRHHGVKRLVCNAFGCCDVPEESTLYRAAFCFVEGSQEQCHECDDEDNVHVARRCSKENRKVLLTQMVTYIHVQWRSCAGPRKTGAAKEAVLHRKTCSC